MSGASGDLPSELPPGQGETYREQEVSSSRVTVLLEREMVQGTQMGPALRGRRSQLTGPFRRRRRGGVLSCINGV